MEGYECWSSEGHCEDFGFSLRHVRATESFEQSRDVTQLTSNRTPLATGWRSFVGSSGGSEAASVAGKAETGGG